MDENIPDDDKKEERINFFKGILTQFGEISDDLYVFFHAIETGRAFLPSCYFNPYSNQFSNTYNFEFLQSMLEDRDKLIHNLIKFYFHEFDDEMVNKCKESTPTLFSYIKKSQYSDEEKSRLYEFFMDPIPYINKLQSELISKEFMLSRYYKDNYEKIIDAFNNTTYELLREQFDGFRDLHFFEKDNEQIYISYCLLNKYCVYFCYLKDGFLPLLGYEYICLLDFVKKESREPDLYNLGYALCEESRVKILQFLLEKEEITCKDLEKAFNFSGSTAYHHITIMVRSGTVKTRNEGKTVLYSLNKKYFDSVIGVLSKYSNLKKGIYIS